MWRVEVVMRDAILVLYWVLGRFTRRPSRWNRMVVLRKIIRLLLVLCILAAVGLAGAFYWWANAPLKLPQKELDITVKPYSPLRAVALQLQQGGLPMNRRLFEALTRFKRMSTSLKSGNYAFFDQVTPYQVLLKVARGDVNQYSVTVIEGWSLTRMRAEIDTNPNLNHDSAAMSGEQLMAAIGHPEKSAEGMFFPDTYLFPKGSSDLDIYRRAYSVAQQRLNDVWAGRATGLPINTPYEALILASLVEKETGRSGERSQVAAVFVNRLRINMPLQTDPSVIYGLTGSFDGRLTKKDLQTDTPYNTYTRRGLPPTPIAMPGLAALSAAMHPAASNALYFVARGDGSSIFSFTLDEHNRAVNKYQRGNNAAAR